LDIYFFPSIAIDSVFGKVTDGLDVVDKIEKVGSQSGKTSKTVVVADCGEL
jgi:cyclophilin family peptidyl-prolyl cis-trans isomerase